MTLASTKRTDQIRALRRGQRINVRAESGDAAYVLSRAWRNSARAAGVDIWTRQNGCEVLIGLKGDEAPARKHGRTRATPLYPPAVVPVAAPTPAPEPAYVPEPLPTDPPCPLAPDFYKPVEWDDSDRAEARRLYRGKKLPGGGYREFCAECGIPTEVRVFFTEGQWVCAECESVRPKYEASHNHGVEVRAE